MNDSALTPNRILDVAEDSFAPLRCPGKATVVDVARVLEMSHVTLRDAVA